MSLSPLARSPHPTDVIDDEWALVATYLLLLPEDTLQRRYSLRFGRSAYYVGRESAVVL